MYVSKMKGLALTELNTFTMNDLIWHSSDTTIFEPKNNLLIRIGSDAAVPGGGGQAPAAGRAAFFYKNIKP